MDQQSTDHGTEDGQPPVHLPDPSIWPLALGIAALLVGIALVFWTRQRDNSFSGPALGAAFALLMASVAGWAYQDGRMKRKAESHEHSTSRDARYTQVVTFAIPQGRLESSQDGGILAAIQGSGSGLRDLAGFQDLRIIAAPADTGPSQVIVETTWSGRDGLATYEETRQTMLDFIADHPEDVVPGSPQIFDMQVVRDTKDMAFKFGLGPTVAVFGALIVGGFFLGAGLNAFHHDKKVESVAPGGGGGGGGTPQPANNVVIATDDAFNPTTLTAPPNTQVTFKMENQGKGIHNLHFYTDSSASKDLAPGSGSQDDAIRGGQTQTLTFTTPGVGTYYFHCDFHPTQMKGTLEVKEGDPVPGGATSGGSGASAGGGGGSASSGPISVSATNDKFDKSEIDVKAGTPVQIDFTNNDATPHNIHFFTDSSASKDLAPGSGSSDSIVRKGQTEKLTFTVPAPGTYFFHCDLHPDTMQGKLVAS
ncbi:MAG TPA: cupredoxin domain-containing protein [Tepidiformaceae bacterium]|nr:cupredoxin domain-containing protein [Tepidiformaceae bacterium]